MKKVNTITFEDVTLEEMPERIITFDYGFLDTLDALGVEGIVGVAANGGKGNIPAHLKEKYVQLMRCSRRWYIKSKSTSKQ